jgi:hypothetical protein
MISNNNNVLSEKISKKHTYTIGNMKNVFSNKL